MGWQDRAYNQENNGGVPPVQFKLPKLSGLTASLIVVNLALFLTKALPGDVWTTTIRWGALELRDGHWFSEPWRWITYQYLHANAGHVIFNMLGVYFFIPSLEAIWGWRKTLGFYTLGGIAGGIVFSIIAAASGEASVARIVGASGAVLATLGGVALMFPSQQLVLLFFLVPIRLAAALIGGLFLLTAVADHDLSNACHLGGLVFGFFAPWIAGPTLARYRQKYRRMKIQRDAAYEAREQEQIDHILEKVSHQGMQSLTGAEKRALQRATERQRKQEVARGRRAF